MAKYTQVIWLMLPAGKIIDDVIEELLPGLEKKSIIIDGGNSNFKDSILRAEKLAKKEIYFLDCGTSGGLQGKENGFSLMIGGDISAYKKVENLFKIIAAPDGFGHVGPSGRRALCKNDS